jgi:hypothetical protein
LTHQWSEEGLNFEGAMTTSDAKTNFLPIIIKEKSEKDIGDYMLVCPKCKSENIYYDALVNVYDSSDIRYFDSGYCEDCEYFTKSFEAGDDEK